jgi:hypothetical protein
MHRLYFHVADRHGTGRNLPYHPYFCSPCLGLEVRSSNSLLKPCGPLRKKLPKEIQDNVGGVPNREPKE